MIGRIKQFKIIVVIRKAVLGVCCVPGTVHDMLQVPPLTLLHKEYEAHIIYGKVTFSECK